MDSDPLTLTPLFYGETPKYNLKTNASSLLTNI